MSKIIAVWGGYGTGKTTVATQIAESFSRDVSVVLVSGNYITPHIPMLFPNDKIKDKSIGKCLSVVDISQKDIFENIIINDEKNIGYMGYLLEENKRSYPAYEEEKVDEFLEVLSETCDIIILDCMSEVDIPFTSSALKNADKVVQLVNANLKSISFLSSQMKLVEEKEIDRSKFVTIINQNDENYTPSIQEVSLLSTTVHILSFYSDVKQAALNGEMAKKIKNSKFNKQIGEIMRSIV